MPASLKSALRQRTSTRVRAEHHPADNDALALLGVSTAAARLLRYFALRPDARPHGRYLQRVLALSGSQLEREMRAFVELGALERIEEGRLVRYAVAPHSKLWRAMRALISERADPGVIVREALQDVPGIEAAFLFGSSAKGTAREDSDVDVFVVANETLDHRMLNGQLHEAGVLLGRDVNTVRYTTQTLAARLGDHHHPARHFVREVLQGPKRWVAGSERAFLPIVTAAGLHLAGVATTK